MAENYSTEKIMHLLISSERIADNVLINKQESVSLDKHRQETRVATREINKHQDGKVWVTIGSMLVKMDREKAFKLLEKDQARMENEIINLQLEQKFLLNKLRDVEYKLPFKGSILKPMSSREIASLKGNLPFTN